MTGVWRRRGRMALETQAASWAHTHAALPVVERRADRLFVYLSVRDTDGRARIGRAELTMDPTPTLSPLEPNPVLDLGALGAFDDSGVTTSCLVTDGPRRLLFYTGWSLGVSVPFYLMAGLAVSVEGGPFTRLSAAPVMERSAVDPFLTASPFVLHECDRWRAWYVSATEWRPGPSGPAHYYHIRYAESGDGVAWIRDGTVCLDYTSLGEHAFSRPWVVRDRDMYRMWFAVRGARYAIGYAESEDGIRWNRQSSPALTAGSEAWESDMVAYPCVFDWRGQRYMLYNGNDYGRTGIGLAVLDA